MPQEQLKKEKQIEVMMEHLKKCMIADLRSGKMVLNASNRKQKTHYDLQKAREEIDAFKRQFC